MADTEFSPNPPSLTLDQAVKARYEANPNTNVFTDAEKAKLASVANGATGPMPDAEIVAAIDRFLGSAEWRGGVTFIVEADGKDFVVTADPGEPLDIDYDGDGIADATLTPTQLAGLEDEPLNIIPPSLTLTDNGDGTYTLTISPGAWVFGNEDRSVSWSVADSDNAMIAEGEDSAPSSTTFSAGGHAVGVATLTVIADDDGAEGPVQETATVEIPAAGLPSLIDFTQITPTSSPPAVTIEPVYGGHRMTIPIGVGSPNIYWAVTGLEVGKQYVLSGVTEIVSNAQNFYRLGITPTSSSGDAWGIGNWQSVKNQPDGTLRTWPEIKFTAQATSANVYLKPEGEVQRPDEQRILEHTRMTLNEVV